MVIVLCILGILVAAFGVVAAWRINTSLTESLTQLLASIDGILVVVETGLESFNAGISDMVDLVQSVEETIAETGETVKETNLMLLAIDATIGDKLFPLLEKASATIEMVVDSVPRRDRSPRGCQCHPIRHRSDADSRSRSGRVRHH
ncbi:MAG: hypothetical protein ACERKX_11475 [Anaerolineales bacterium]